MSVPYLPPGVSITEIVSPQFNPTALDPNSVVIAGPAQGFQTHTEIVLLDDKIPYPLSSTFPDVSTISVVDATDLTLAPFTASTPLAEHDYDIDITGLASGGVVTIARAMQTHIATGEEVVVYLENSASANQGNSFTNFVTLDHTTGSIPTHAATGTQAASIKVQKQGKAPNADYTIAGAGGATPTIVWTNVATVLQKFQTVYLDYVVATVAFKDVPVQLNNLTTVALTANADSIVVKTAPGANTAVTASNYAKGTTTDLDYIITGTGATTTIARSVGSTTMGVGADKIVVKLTYQATPATYWLPTRCYSIGDVSDKYGPAFDSSGNISSPVTYAASLAFANGLNSVIIQALFTEGNPRTAPTGTLQNWSDTLANLYSVEDMTVLVPVIAANSTVAVTDALNLQILTAVQGFLNFMALNQKQFIIAICGEDSTGGTLASEGTLQSHSESLRAGSPTSLCLVNTGSFVQSNPVTGKTFNVGGQYFAAAVAGMFGKYAVQTPFTRKRVGGGFTAVNDIRNTGDKNADATAGLLVAEAARGGGVQLRHAITVDDSSVAARDLNVVRSKFWMLENLRVNLDSQFVGNIVIDDNASFQIQLGVTDVLEQMVSQGAIVSYNNIQVRRDPIAVDAMQVQFEYLPAYGLNNINLSFSISSTGGVILTNTSNSGLLTQGT